MLIPSISLLFRIIMPKMPIQCCWYRIYIKQSPLWMWLHATFLDEQDELIKLLKNITNDFILYDNLHAAHTGNCVVLCGNMTHKDATISVLSRFLDANKIASISSDSFLGLYGLLFLRLDANNLTEIPREALAKLQRLQALWVW